MNSQTETRPLMLSKTRSVEKGLEKAFLAIESAYARGGSGVNESSADQDGSAAGLHSQHALHTEQTNSISSSNNSSKAAAQQIDADNTLCGASIGRVGRPMLSDLPDEILDKIYTHLLDAQALPRSSLVTSVQRRRNSRAVSLSVPLAPNPTAAATTAGPAWSTGDTCQPSGPLRTFSTCRVDGAPGLRDMARASGTDRRFNKVFRELCSRRTDLALQVEANIRALSEKKRLVRRMTLTHHGTYMRNEVACEVGGGGMLIAILLVSCIAWPSLCNSFSSTLNFLIFILTHLCIHTAILAGAYRAAAHFGIRKTLFWGLSLIVLYYCGIVSILQMACGITHVPPHLDLEPWNRAPACLGTSCQTPQGAMQKDDMLSSGSGTEGYGRDPATVPLNAGSAPFYPLAVIVWPLFGTSLRWRAIHVLSNSFAWVYGVWEFAASFCYIKSRNGLA